jgi:hypothetical protein
MTNLLSTISGKFSTNLVLGTFFPVTVFVFLARVLWVPLLPSNFRPAFLTPFAGLNDKWELLVLTLVTVVLSGLLFNINVPLIRVYEGYPWEKTWIGRRKAARYRSLLESLAAQKAGLDPLRRELRGQVATRRAANPHDAEIRGIETWIARAPFQELAVSREIFADFPKASSVLPTRLGNVIRSFENYPERQYGMSAIDLWPRLIAVLDASYAEMLDGAKASFDFMLNSAILSLLLGAILLITGLVDPVALSSRGAVTAWLGEVAVLFGVSFWFYGGSIDSARSWGNLVRGAFDLYRGKLLEKLGYSCTLETTSEERKFWGAISRRLAVGDPPQWSTESLLPYRNVMPLLTSCGSALGAALKVTRGVRRPDPGHAWREIVVEVRNPAGPPMAAVGELVVVDTVPDGYDYEWNSAQASEGEVNVEGTNPYRFYLSGTLAPWSTRELTYRIVRRTRNSP